MTLDTLLRTGRKHEASDIHIVVGMPPVFRVGGEIVVAKGEAISAAMCQALVRECLNEEQQTRLETDWQLCFSTMFGERDRARVTIYLRNGFPEVSIRLSESTMRTRAQLHLPAIVDDLAHKPNGLIVITGPTGVGKTTTFHYIIDLINSESRSKIVTIEDPIEYTHISKLALVIQQEVLTDVHSFNRALIHVLRQDPDVIVVGEMRDPEAIATALTAAETGHLVLVTMHSPSVSHAIERIIGVFEGSAQRQVVMQLSNALQGIISQDLLPAADRTRRVLAYELVVANGAVRNLIRENQLHQLENMIQTGRKDGMMLMDNCLYDLYCKCAITYDTAISRAHHPDSIIREKSRAV